MLCIHLDVFHIAQASVASSSWSLLRLFGDNGVSRFVSIGQDVWRSMYNNLFSTRSPKDIDPTPAKPVLDGKENTKNYDTVIELKALIEAYFRRSLLTRIMYEKPSPWLLVNCDRHVPLGCEDQDVTSRFQSESITLNVYGEDLGGKSLCYRYVDNKKGQCVEVKSLSTQSQETTVQEQGKECGYSLFNNVHTYYP
jgi:hypothetical protein